MTLSDLDSFLLYKHPLFEGIKEEELQLLLQSIDKKEYSKNEIIIHKNAFSDALYLLVEGEVTFYKLDAHPPSQMIHYLVQAPAILGESTFLDPGAYPFDLYAHGEKNLLYILHRQTLEANQSNSPLLNQLLLHLVRLELGGLRPLPVILSKEPKEESKEAENQHHNQEMIQQLLVDLSEYHPDHHFHKASEFDHANNLRFLSPSSFNKEEDQAPNQEVIQSKSLWLLSLVGLILSFLDPYKSLGNASTLIITLFQIGIPVVLIHFFLKESLKNWGWNRRFLAPSLFQALIGIGIIGGGFEIVSQVADVQAFQFFSLQAWQHMLTSPLASIISYFILVIVEEWLRRGVVTLSLQRGLKNNKGWTALLSSLLFMGLSPISFPLFAFALLMKDFLLAKLFLRAPHLLGVILMHFILGLFFASLGWFTL